MVGIGAQVDKLLNSANVALPDCIVNTGLPVFILSVDIVASLVDEEIDRLTVSLPRGIKNWSLLQRIFLDWVHTELDEHF